MSAALSAAVSKGVDINATNIQKIVQRHAQMKYIFFITASILLLFASRAQAQAVVSPFMGVGSVQLLNNNGGVLSNGAIYFYQAGTSTQQATYTDATGAVQNPDPVTLDSSGRASIWLLSSAIYKIVLCSQNDGSSCASGDVLFTQDQVPGSQANLSQSTFFGTFISGSASPASSGSLRLASGDAVCWRNSANSGNLCIAKDTSDVLEWSGAGIKFPGISTPPCLAGFDYLWADSTSARWMACNNGAAPVQLVDSGVDINTSDQVTNTHLAGPLPIAQGGTGTASPGSTGSGCVSVSGSFPTQAIGCEPIAAFYQPTACTWASQNIVAAVTQLCSETVTMPASGCPCRIQTPYTIFWDSSIALDVEAWVQTTDATNGTVTFGDSTQGTAGASGAYMTTGASPYSKVLYANGASVTVKLYYEGSAAANSPVGIHQAGRFAPDNSGLSIAVISSN